MRIFSITLFLYFFVSNVIIGQNVEKKLNLIVVIDQKIIVEGLYQIKLSSGSKIYTARYEPGNLIIDDTSNTLSKIDSLPVTLSFYHNVYNKKGLVNDYHYKIPLERVWLERSFIVLRIYNTDRKPYKKMYNPLKGLNYTFELDLPTGSIKRITKNPSH